MKLVPFTTTVVSAAPATSELGLTDAIVGPMTVNGLAAEETEEAPLPLTTVRPCKPALVKLALGMLVVMEVAVPAVMVSGLPLK
jgi:hypothetical protein